MKGLLLLGLCFISLVVFSNGLSKNVSRPKVVKIGALFNFDSDTGRVAKIAIQEAVNDVNDNFTVLQGTKLDITFRNSNYSGFIGMIQALQFMQTDVVAIVGPQSSVVAHMISDVANELQVPLVSFAATDPTLSTLDFPYFVRTTHSDEYQMTAIADIIEYYGWKEVIAIYVDDEYGRNGVAALDDALADRRCRLIYKTGISPGSDVTRSELMDILVKVAMLESRVVVLHVNNDQGLMVFNVASYLGMMGNGYVWISNDWLSSSLDSSSLSPETMNTIQGVLTLRQHIPNLNMEKTFSSRWRNLTGGSLGLNSYGFYAYDSVWVLAHAIDAYLNQGGIISFSNISHILPQGASSLHLEAMHIFDGGEALLNNVLNSNLVGLTGPLKFNSERSLTRPAYDIINVIGTGYRQIGYWSNYSGLSTVIPETLYKKPPNSSSANQYLYPPVWPDGTTTPPRGWVFPNNGKQLKIGVPIRVSFKEFVSEVPGSNDFKGFCIDVFQAAVNLLSYPVPYQFVGFGDGHRNPNYTDLVNMIAAGNYDAVVGDVAIVTSRTRIVDFTQPYVASGLVLVAPFKKLNSGAWAFLRPFTPLTWGVIVVLFVVIGVIIWILEHRINDEFRGSPRSQFITILWFSFSTLTFSHRESPVSTLGRMVVLIWLFVVLILTSSYTASLTSILTVQQLSSPIKGIESLRSGDELIGYQTGSFAEQYLREELNISRTRLVAVDSPEDYAAAFRDGRIDALVDERPYVELFLSSRCDFRIVGQEFTRSGWGFAFPRDSPLALDFSTAILKLSENGDLQRIHDKWLTIGSCSSDNSEIESSQLHFRSFSGLFLICGLACVIALLIYFVRIFRRFLRTQTEVASDPQGSLRLSRLQTLLSLMDEKKDPSKRRKKRRKMEESSDDDVIDEESGKKFKRCETQSSRCGDSSPSN